jgi:hypothetical protein
MFFKRESNRVKALLEPASKVYEAERGWLKLVKPTARHQRSASFER